MHSLKFDDLPFTVSEEKDGQALVSFKVPVDFVETIPALLASLFSLFAMVKTRSRVANAVAAARSKKALELSRQRNAALSDFIVSAYDRHYASGIAPRAALAAVKSDLEARGRVVSSYVIECFLRQSGRFSKRKGFQPL
ncbi:MAG: hypothetical protein AB7U43_05210 [Desulfobacter sp.]